MKNILEIEEQEQKGTREASVRQKATDREEDTERREGEKQREEGERESGGAAEQEKTSAPWEHSDGLSKASLCSHCWSASQN